LCKSGAGRPGAAGPKKAIPDGVSVEFLLSLPAFVKVGACFAAMLLLYRGKVPLGWSILASALLLAASTGNGLAGFVHVARSFTEPASYLMLLVIFLLTYFSDALAHTGTMEKSVDAFRRIFKNQRMLLAGLPALIGLLPMPGGALFSAPFVASADETASVSAELKSAINYWFRHVWEYWWPLYPGVILAIQYSGLPVALFLLVQIPFTLASIFGGWLFMLRAIPAGRRAAAAPTDSLWSALQTLWPIAVLVLISGIASAVLPAVGVSKSLANLYGMTAGLLTALVFVFWNRPAMFRQSCRAFLTGSTWSLMLAVASVLLFSSVLRMPLDGSSGTLVTSMRDEFMRMGIPLLLIIMLIPFISGLVTGITIGFVGASFPIVFSLLGAHPPQGTLVAATSLAFVSGYIGEILSPMHLCFVLSNEYFKSRMLSTWRYLAGPSIIVALAMAILCCAYYFLIP
jgi:hypothetical protein